MSVVSNGLERSRERLTLAGTALPSNPCMSIAARLVLDTREQRELQQFTTNLMASRTVWLRLHNRRLPTEEQLDRERYGAFRKEVRYDRARR